MKKHIRQTLLEEYQQLHKQEKMLRAKREALREQLISQLRGDAFVEPGDLDACLVECSCVSLSRAKVIAAIGLERYERLRAKIEPTIRTHLRIKKAEICWLG